MTAKKFAALAFGLSTLISCGQSSMQNSAVEARGKSCTGSGRVNVVKVYWEYAGDRTHETTISAYVTGAACTTALSNCKRDVRKLIQRGEITSWSHCALR